MRILSVFLTAVWFACGVLGHGRLQVPKTRKHAAVGSDVYENDPVSGSDSPSYACRNDPGASVPSENRFQAGSEMTVRWSLSAAHVGDCALYVSYDYDKRGADRANMKFFKIANWRKCKDINNQDQTVRLPSWLPEGRAVIRWGWYALHVFPKIEFYAQCADSYITGTAQSLQASQVPSYSIVGLYPLSGNNGELRNPWASPPPSFFTGPPCACRDSQANGCPISADTSSPGYIAVPTLTQCGGDDRPVVTRPPAGGNATPSPTVPRQATPSPTVGSGDTVTAPPSSAPAPNGNCPSVCTTCRTYNGNTCTLWCSKWDYCGSSSDHKSVGSTDCRACGDSPPVAAPTNAPTDAAPAPTDAPTELVIDCVATMDGLPKGKSTKNKKFQGDACACSLMCEADTSKGPNKAFGFSAAKRQCICYYKPKSKKGKLKTSNKGDFVYAEL